MKKLHAYINSITTPKTIKTLLILTLLNGVLFLIPPFSIITTKHLDTIQFYSANQVYQILTAQGEAGRAASNLMHWTIDLTFPILLSALLALWITSTWKKVLPAENPWLYLNLLPLVFVLADYAENITSLTLISRFPEELLGLAQAVSIFSTFKWLGMISSILVGIIGLLRARRL